jgi:hypothetical protein
MAQSGRALTLALYTACWLLAQQGTLPSSAVFSSETKLVLVSFNVQRGAYFAPDLKSDEILLLEDGKRRDFTIFEGPEAGSRPPLELVLSFDTTTLPIPGSKARVVATHWDRNATYEFTNHWGDTESRAVLEMGGADIRTSVYRFDREQMQRLCRSTSDAATLTGAIRRLTTPIPPAEAIPLQLPAGRMTFAELGAKQLGATVDPNPRLIRWPISWTLEAAIGAMKDSSAAPDNALRALVVFSEMTGMTTTTPEDVAEQASALGISIYPVVLDLEKYKRQPFSLSKRKGESEYWADNPNIQRLVMLGELTSGQSFSPDQLDANVVTGVLNSIRNRSLSQYIVGFAPLASAQHRNHRLEIKLKSKDSGKLLGGKRTAVY